MVKYDPIFESIGRLDVTMIRRLCADVGKPTASGVGVVGENRSSPLSQLIVAEFITPRDIHTAVLLTRNWRVIPGGGLARHLLQLTAILANIAHSRYHSGEMEISKGAARFADPLCLPMTRSSDRLLPPVRRTWARDSHAARAWTVAGFGYPNTALETLWALCGLR